MRGSWSRRMAAALVITVLVAGVIALLGIGSAGACEELQIQLPGVARGYDASGGGAFNLDCVSDPDTGLYLDGIVTNDTSVTVVPDHVRIGWAESTGTPAVEEWICSGPIAPHEWAAFHTDWPADIPTTWTPVVTGYAWPSDPDDKYYALTITDVSEATTGDAGGRSYTVTVTNPHDFAVSSLCVNAIERETSSTDLVDTLEACCAPDSIGAHGSAQFDVTGLSPWDGVLSTDIHVVAQEQPQVALRASTASPLYGSPVTFHLTLASAEGTPVTGDRTLKLYSSRDGEDWCDYKCYDTSTGDAVAVVTPNRPTYYKAVYWGGHDLGQAESAVIFVKPQVAAGPPIAPNVVHARHTFRVRGRMCAGAKSAGKAISVITERKRGSHWARVSKANAKADSAGRFVKSVKVSKAGTYRVRAHRAGVGYSKYATFRATR
jgi:hypothetical protein